MVTTMHRKSAPEFMKTLLTGEMTKLTSAITEALGFGTGHIEHTEQQIVERGLPGNYEMPVPLDLTTTCSDEDNGQVMMRMKIAVADTAAIEHQRMVKQAASSVTSVLQLLNQVGKHLHMEFVDFCRLGNLVGIILMMRARMMAIGDPDRAICSRAALAGDHETDDPRQV